MRRRERVVWWVRAVGIVSLVACGGAAGADEPRTIGSIERLDPAFDQLVPADARIEVLGEGFRIAEGPVWVPARQSLLFSDIPAQRIFAWRPEQGVSVFRGPSDNPEQTLGAGRPFSTNGLTLDAQGRLVMCCPRDRVIRRLEPDGTLTTLADRYQGRRFNSPNDLTYRRNGDLYFTDPPYGLERRLKDPQCELSWCGVYRLSPDGTVTLLTTSLYGPNGIGFSPDEKTLYVSQSEEAAAIWMAFPVREDGTLDKGRVFFDATVMCKEDDGPDSLAVDPLGNIWASGPGGVLVFDPSAKLLGRLDPGEPVTNCAFGEDGQTLFITAVTRLCRVRTLVPRSSGPASG